jgi:ABC-type lipoprotein export system ATPase subunit
MQLVLDDLGHSYGDVSLFRQLTRVFEPGRSYAITGASGSGKSTLMAIIAGWIAPAEGRVVRDSIDTTSWVLQNPFGVARRSAIDHVAYPFIARGLSAAESDARAAQLLGNFELASVADRQFGFLSGGEAQRLMLARATAVSPDLLLVDEPTAQLDRSTARVVNRVLSNVVSSDTIVIVATHDEETRDACDEHVDLTSYAAVES